MHTPAPRTLPQRTTEATYPGGTEHIRTSAPTSAQYSKTARGQTT